MTPREALEQFGTLYTPGRKNGHSGKVHTDGDCHTLPNDCRTITTASALPLRPDLCRHCDPDATVDMSPDYDVPAIEDHDDRPPWAPSPEVADD